MAELYYKRVRYNGVSLYSLFSGQMGTKRKTRKGRKRGKGSNERSLLKLKARLERLRAKGELLPKLPMIEASPAKASSSGASPSDASSSNSFLWWLRIRITFFACSAWYFHAYWINFSSMVCCFPNLTIKKTNLSAMNVMTPVFSIFGNSFLLREKLFRITKRARVYS